jgi:hypothetical protein
VKKRKSDVENTTDTEEDCPSNLYLPISIEVQEEEAKKIDTQGFSEITTFVSESSC